MDKLDLLNKVARVARPSHHEFIPLNSLEEKFAESCLDSMDMLMVGMYMCEIYDVENEISKLLNPEDGVQLYAFLEEHGTPPVSIEAAMEVIK